MTKRAYFMKKKKTANIFFISASLISLAILIVTLTLLRDILKIKAEKQRQLNYYNYQVEQYRKSGDPLITPAYR